MIIVRNDIDFARPSLNLKETSVMEVVHSACKPLTRAMYAEQVVCIEPTTTCTQTVTVKTGDTCYLIYTANGLTQAQLQALNPGLNCECVPFRHFMPHRINIM